MTSSGDSSADGTLPQGSLVAERYKIIRFIGSGAMGNVYQTHDLMLQSDDVAIKILHYEHSRNERLIQRFLQELGHTHNISHPNVVRTYDFGRDRGSLFFTMEYVPGVTLDRYEPLQVFKEELLEKTLIQICSGLAAIHAAGIVHRDLKHGNIIILPDGSLKIADFGIARPESTSLTPQREVAGSVDFLAPEIWEGGAIRNAVDFYALGCLLYELLTGKLPFENKEIHRTIWGHVFTQAPEPAELLNGLPPWLNTLSCWLLSKDPIHRPHSAVEIIQFITHPERNQIVPIHEDSKKYRSAVAFDEGVAEKMLENAFLPSPAHRPIVGRKTDGGLYRFCRFLLLLILLFGAAGLYLVRNHPPSAAFLQHRLFEQMPKDEASTSLWSKLFLRVTGLSSQGEDSTKTRQLKTQTAKVESFRELLGASLEKGMDFGKLQGEGASLLAAVTDITKRHLAAKELLDELPELRAEPLQIALSQMDSRIEAERLIGRTAKLQARLWALNQTVTEFAYCPPKECQALHTELRERRLDVDKALRELNGVKRKAVRRFKVWISFARRVDGLELFALAAAFAEKDERIAAQVAEYRPLYQDERSELDLTLESLWSFFDPEIESSNSPNIEKQKADEKLKESIQRLIHSRLAGLLHALITISEFEYLLREELDLIGAKLNLLATFPLPRTRDGASIFSMLRRERNTLANEVSTFSGRHSEERIQELRLILHLGKLETTLSDSSSFRRNK